MDRSRRFALAGVLVSIAASAAVFATPLEQAFIATPNWCPGNGCGGVTIQNQHQSWHSFFAGTREFVDYHRELLATSDDYRLFLAAPAPAAFAVTPKVGAVLEFTHTSLNTFVRPAAHVIDAGPPLHADPGGFQRFWPVRPAVLTLGNATFCGYNQATFGTAIDGMFHGNGHMSVATHDLSGLNGDMGNVTSATRDGAFFQWHKYIDNVYGDWAVGKYQYPACGGAKTGIPIVFSMKSTAVGAAGSVLTDRRGATTYQGNRPPLGAPFNPATQYGAIPRIASDLYVADNNGSNLLYASGVKKSNAEIVDIDAFTVLNPPGSGWYFSVTMGSAGAPGTAVNAQAVKGGDVFQSAGGGANALYRAEAALGLAAAGTDELDALEVDQQTRIQGTNDTSAPGVYDRPKQYFSLGPDTTVMPKTSTGGVIALSDILRFGTKGELEIVVAGATLGLGVADNLDSLVIVDTAPFDVVNGTDRIYYTLAPGSPSLGASSPADIFCHTVAGVACGTLGGRLEATAASLGLLATDHIDGLDVVLAPAVGACCTPAGTCSEVTSAACTGGGGTFSGLGTVCSGTVCPSTPGACCNTNGACSALSDQACIASGGVFKGTGVTCASANCPSTPNDDCGNAYPIPYDRPNYYEPPPQYEDNTYAYTAPTDPPYTCSDHNTFFPDYGSGTIWYSYDVPSGPGPKRPLYVDTYQTAPDYPYNGGAGDTKIAVYYSPSGNCSTLQEVACNDNTVKGEDYTAIYSSVQYNSPAPGRYYVQVASVGDANRGKLRIRVADTTATVPTLGTWGMIALVTLLALSGAYLLRKRTWTAAALVLICLGGLFFATGASWTDKLGWGTTRPGAEDWPAGSRLARDPRYPTLVMFANPECPCTEASLSELRALTEKTKVRAYVLFAKDPEHAADLSTSKNWIAARSIRGVTALPDDAAGEAALFGARTSSQVVVFDPEGHLLFSGAIGPRRGMEGRDHAMAEAVTDVIERANDGRPQGARVEMLNSVQACALLAAKK